MDARTFDRLTAAGAHCPTRRTTLRLLASGLIGALLSRHGAGLVHAAQRPDRDGDGLFDDDEVEVYGTNPDIYDTDGDGVGDGEEVYLGTNPLDGGGVGLAPVACAQVGQSCAAAECCLGFCTQDEICECVNDGFACAGVANGGCCTGSCNTDGFCGSCQMLGARCNADAECCQGSYAALCCFSGVSLTTVCTDVTNIGFACPGDAPPAAGCPAGQTACGGTCADLSSHAGHCGACFNSCPLGGYCQGGQCVGTVCFDGLTDCGVGYCVNTLNDALHCGACGVVCPEANLCNRGICQSTEPVEPGGGGGGAPPELDCDGGEEQTDEFGRETGLCAPRVHEPERPTG